MSQAFFKGGALDPDCGAARRPTGRNEKNNKNRTATTDAFISNLLVCYRCERLLSERSGPIPLEA
jgi:hypothetical protein